MPRTYLRIKTAIPAFWSDELKNLFGLWRQDMLNGLTPYTPITTQTFEKRFILYTRRQFEGKLDNLSIQKAFDVASVYAALTSYSIESFSNRHNLLYSIISFAKFLIKLGILEEPLLERLRKLRPKRVIPPKKTVLRDTSEIDRLKQAISEKSYESEYSRILDQTIVETFLQTGIRLAELCKLNFSDVDFENRIIHVYLGKGRKNRKVGITSTLLESLNHYLPARHKKLSETSNLNETAYFVNRYGTRIKPADITRRLQKLSRLAGIKITPHGLRRTFATLHANQGRPLNMIQLALGHSDIRTTQEYLMTDENQVIQAMREW